MQAYSKAFRFKNISPDSQWNMRQNCWNQQTNKFKINEWTILKCQRFGCGLSPKKSAQICVLQSNVTPSESCLRQEKSIQICFFWNETEKKTAAEIISVTEISYCDIITRIIFLLIHWCQQLSVKCTFYIFIYYLDGINLCRVSVVRMK